MANTRLLLVDDEERFLVTTKSVLEKRGYQTFVASNGLDAMAILEEKHIDVIILDVKMPGLDGVEVLRRIKQKHALVEVIMLTGHSTTESAVEGLKLGAFDYIMKPCDVKILLEKVDKAHNRKQAMEEKLQKEKINKIISHPLSVFEKD